MIPAASDKLPMRSGFRRNASKTEPGQGKAAPGTNDELLQTLLELRLLRLFRELRDYNTKCILIELTEQIVRRQGPRRGDAG